MGSCRGRDVKRVGWIAAAVVGVLVLGGWGGYRLLQLKRVGGPFGLVQVQRPASAPRALVLLLGEGRDTPRLAADAQALTAAGAVVGVVDVRRYLARAGQDCAQYAVDLNWLGERVLRGAGVDDYIAPLLVGVGQGAQMARAALVHSRSPDVSAGVVERVAGAAPIACQAAAAPGLGEVVEAAPDAVVATSVARFAPPAAPFRGLPLVEMPHADAQRLVILMTGDGGWQPIDQQIATALHDQGAAVIGWSSLRYFWKAKTPERTAADLSAVIAEYQRRWHVSQVDLVGYSFGADVLPFLYGRLPAAQQGQVRRVALLGLATNANFTVRIGGWLGWSAGSAYPIKPQLARIPAQKILCVYGQDEDEDATLCPSLRGTGVEVRMAPGGHHFETGQVAGWITGPAPGVAVAGLTSAAAPAR